MTPDVKRLIDFYKSPLGKLARALVREEVMRFSGDVRGRRILGLGFATPYLRFSLEKAERVVAIMPAPMASLLCPVFKRAMPSACQPSKN